MKVLLVEDDQLLGEGVVAALRQQHCVMEWAHTGRNALMLVRSTIFDVIILDLGLPDMEGIEVLKQLRAGACNKPVLILTARDATADKVQGLDAGADDFLAKPFDLDELMARLRALCRRSTGVRTPVLKFGTIEISPSNHQVLLAREQVHLSRHEYDLLHHLVTHPLRVFSREMLVEQLYSWDEAIGSNTVEVYVHHLRKKLGKAVIRTVRGLGYQLGEAPE